MNATIARDKVKKSVLRVLAFVRWCARVSAPTRGAIRRVVAPVFVEGNPFVVRPIVLWIFWGVFAVALIAAAIWIRVDVQAPGTVVAINAKRFIPDVRTSIYVWCALSVALYVLVFRFQYTKRQARTAQMLAVMLCGIVLVICLGIHPTRSQDAYWSLLLARGATAHHMNPYTTTPNMLVRDGWSASVISWRTQTMSHGVLWTVPLMGITLLTTQLTTALVYTKLFLYIGLIAVYAVLWWILSHDENRTLIESRKLWIFLVLQPMWFQYIAIDMHNDVWVALSLLVSFWYLKKERYQASSIALILGGCVKYVPLFLLPIPIILALRKEGSWKAMLSKQRATIELLVACSIIFFTVQFSKYTTLGLYTEIFERGRKDFLLLGSQIVSFFVGGHETIVRIVGLLMMFGVLAYYIKQKKYVHAYVVPFVVLLICGTPWFQSWYALWILPLAIMLFSPRVMTIAVTALLFMFEIIMPSQISVYIVLCCALLAVIYICAALVRSIRTPKITKIV
ncbi:MAG: hypothetical protein KIH62_004015 [Candidatus Kerfeldbacteria bacterium]|nr:hypothetical protein [Candidatus Kerfeldbacteria bacterium]